MGWFILSMALPPLIEKLRSIASIFGGAVKILINTKFLIITDSVDSINMLIYKDNIALAIDRVCAIFNDYQQP